MGAGPGAARRDASIQCRFKSAETSVAVSVVLGRYVANALALALALDGTLIHVVSSGVRSVRGSAIGVAIALALVASACSSRSSGGDAAPRDAGPDRATGTVDAADARADASDAQADAADARADASDAQADAADAGFADAADARPDFSIAVDANADAVDAAGADSRPDGAADVPADVGFGLDAPTDVLPGLDAPTDVPSGLDAPTDAPSGLDAPADVPLLPGCASAGNLLCETFEGTLPGSLPTASPWLNHPVSGICDSNSTLAVDETQPHGGARELTSHSFSNQCVLEADLGVHPELWVRAWVRSDVPGPGQVDASQVDVSEMTLFGIGTNQFGDDPRIAVGYSGTVAFSPCSQAPGISVNTTGSSPAAGCTGTPLPTGKWLCFELHVTQAGSTVHAQLYIDGQIQTFSSPTPDGGTTTTLTNIYGATVRYLALGVRQYGSRYVTPAHYDDVAAGTERIGCNN